MADDDLREALLSARRQIAFSPRDWAESPDVAWVYGILVGWSDGSTGDDVDDGDALGELAARFGWTADGVERLKRFRAAVEAVAPKRVWFAS